MKKEEKEKLKKSIKKMIKAFDEYSTEMAKIYDEFMVLIKSI